ncbi:hypothetical protein [Streptomyces glaucescens]|nr:hypothetical protein [Streptomyces glaucescens]
MSQTSTIGPPSWIRALTSRRQESFQPNLFGSPLRPLYSRSP